jgi:hypothetical protein
VVDLVVVDLVYQLPMEELVVVVSVRLETCQLQHLELKIQVEAVEVEMPHQAFRLKQQALVAQVL